jgi:hypothetical protein
MGGPSFQIEAASGGRPTRGLGERAGLANARAWANARD